MGNRRDAFKPRLRPRRSTPYSLRHTYASHALAAGIGVFALARARSGSDVTITAGVRPLEVDETRFAGLTRIGPPRFELGTSSPFGLDAA